MLKSNLSYIIGVILLVISGILYIANYKVKDDDPHKDNLLYAGSSFLGVGLFVIIVVGFLYFDRRNE